MEQETCKDNAKLYSKIAAVMGGLATIQPDAKHGQGWKYASATQVFDTMRGLMAGQKLIVIMEPKTIDLIEKRYRVTYTMTLACGDTGATLHSIWIHEGANSGDKALTGIHTNALKYFLMDLFVVSYGDALDSDTNSGTSSGIKQRESSAKSQPAGTNNKGKKQSKTNTKPPKTGDEDSTIRVITQKTPDGKLFMRIGEATLWSREAFRELGFEDEVVDSLGEVGETALSHAVTATWQEDGKWRKVIKLRRDDTGEVVAIAS